MVRHSVFETQRKAKIGLFAEPSKNDVWLTPKPRLILSGGQSSDMLQVL
jgi:hypothetical protein